MASWSGRRMGGVMLMILRNRRAVWLLLATGVVAGGGTWGVSAHRGFCGSYVHTLGATDSLGSTRKYRYIFRPDGSGQWELFERDGFLGNPFFQKKRELAFTYTRKGDEVVIVVSPVDPGGARYLAGRFVWAESRLVEDTGGGAYARRPRELVKEWW